MGIEMATIILIILNVIFSYKGFTDASFFEQYKFDVDKILINKEYSRVITSGFLHLNWMHLIFNMISLYAFSGQLESYVGIPSFLLIYFGSLIGGDLLSLFIHKNHGDYSSVGASGAVCGVIFASIALFRGIGIGIFFLPFFLPGWIYALLYVTYSIYGIKSKKDNIGHEAHLGGAVIGILIAIILYPNSLFTNYLPILIIVVPTVIFIIIIISKPHFLLIDNNFFNNQKRYHSIEDKYNDIKVNKIKEIDLILDKISKKGINSLSTKEKQKLEEHSKK